MLLNCIVYCTPYKKVSDILAPQANAMIIISFYHLSSRYGDSLLFLQLNDILRHIVQPLSTMFTMSSSWIVTTTTLFRLIAVMMPFRARTLINKRLALTFLAIIFSSSLLCIVPLYTSLITRTNSTNDNNHNNNHSNNNNHTEYTVFYMQNSEFMEKIYLPLIQCMCFYLPWMLALVFWIFLLRSLRRSEGVFSDSKTPPAPLPPPPPTPSPTENENGAADSAIGVVVSRTTFCAERLLHVVSSARHRDSTKTISSAKKMSNASSSCTTGGKKMSSASSNGSQRTTFSNRDGASDSQRGYKSSGGGKLPGDAIRISYGRSRKASSSKITYMIVVLCLCNLMSRVFTFVFIFEVIFNVYLETRQVLLTVDEQQMPRGMPPSSSSFFSSAAASTASVDSTTGNEFVHSSSASASPPLILVENARTHYPKFLAYSLLLNNIFLCLNHSCNIFIYAFTNPRFKANLIGFLRECVGKKSTGGGAAAGAAATAAATASAGIMATGTISGPRYHSVNVRKATC